MTHADAVRAIYADFANQNIPAILERLSDDVAWEYAYADFGVPWLLPRRGRDGVAAFFASLAALDFVKFELKEVVVGERVVVALCDLELVVRATGRRIIDVDEPHVWHFDAHGRVAKFRHAANTLVHHDAWVGSAARL